MWSEKKWESGKEEEETQQVLVPGEMGKVACWVLLCSQQEQHDRTIVLYRMNDDDDGNDEVRFTSIDSASDSVTISSSFFPNLSFFVGVPTVSRVL